MKDVFVGSTNSSALCWFVRYKPVLLLLCFDQFTLKLLLIDHLVSKTINNILLSLSMVTEIALDFFSKFGWSQTMSL